MNSDPENDVLCELMLRHLEGATSPDEARQLSLALRNSPQLRREFAELSVQLVQLRTLGVERNVVAPEEFAPAKSERKVLRWRMWPLAAAAALLLVLLWVKLLPLRNDTPAANVAVLARVFGTEWEDAARQPGQALAPGWLRLKTGVAQIEFSRGARVLLEGPAEFRLVSSNEGFLQRGKLRAQVPESAHGFTIRGEGFSVVDRGTEFGVIAGEKPEVHVFAGRVELARATGTESARVMEAGRAVRMGEHHWLDVPADASAFVGPEEVNRMERREVWRRSSAMLDTHPAALVHYDFEPAAGTLANRVPGRDLSASIVGGKAAEGRWPGKGALEFKGAEDRVRFTVPGEMQALTLLAWVRVDGLPNAENALLMSDSERPGDVHWYLRDDGALGFGVIAPAGRWRWVNSPKILSPENRGAWLFVATTFDGATGEVTHYFNGQRVAGEALAGIRTVHLRTVEIGNWGVRPGSPLRVSSILNSPQGYIRNLHGRVDEFAILSAVLPAAEIQRLFESGRTAPDAASASPK